MRDRLVDYTSPSMGDLVDAAVPGLSGGRRDGYWRNDAAVRPANLLLDHGHRADGLRDREAWSGTPNRARLSDAAGRRQPRAPPHIHLHVDGRCCLDVRL